MWRALASTHHLGQNVRKGLAAGPVPGYYMYVCHEYLPRLPIPLYSLPHYPLIQTRADSEMEEPIAFIGVGVMGYAMAGKIRQKMSSRAVLYVNDINLPVCEKFTQEFASHGPIKVVYSAKEAATHASVIISIVPGAAEVREVYLNQETGVIAAPQDPSRLLLDCSTIDCQTSRTVGGKLSEAGSGIFRDAPVSVHPFLVLCGRFLTPARAGCQVLKPAHCPS